MHFLLSQTISANVGGLGEYDSGRVHVDVQARYLRTNSAAKELRRQVGALSELEFTIHSELPQELKWMTFYAQVMLICALHGVPCLRTHCAALWPSSS